MTASNIWAAFREHAAKTSDKTWDDFQREQREPVPYELPAQRRTAMTRLREQYPSVFATVDAPPSFASQWARIEALAAANGDGAPWPLSDRALELVGVRPPRKPDNAPLPSAGVETPEAPPIEEDER